MPSPIDNTASHAQSFTFAPGAPGSTFGWNHTVSVGAGLLVVAVTWYDNVPSTSGGAFPDSVMYGSQAMTLESTFTTLHQGLTYYRFVLESPSPGTAMVSMTTVGGGLSTTTLNFAGQSVSFTGMWTTQSTNGNEAQQAPFVITSQNVSMVAGEYALDTTVWGDGTSGPPPILNRPVTSVTCTQTLIPSMSLSTPGSLSAFMCASLSTGTGFVSCAYTPNVSNVTADEDGAVWISNMLVLTPAAPPPPTGSGTRSMPWEQSKNLNVYPSYGKVVL